ncbi:ATP-binding protein, partial [Streptomyces sp. NPDC056730]
MLLERETELARVGAALSAAEEGTSSVILLSGPLGIGRTALLRQLPGAVSGTDVRVLRANAAPMERDFAFGVVRQLLDSLLSSASRADRERWAREPDHATGLMFEVDDLPPGCPLADDMPRGDTPGGAGAGGPAGAASEATLH